MAVEVEERGGGRGLAADPIPRHPDRVRGRMISSSRPDRPPDRPPDLVDYSVQTTFDPERDREPHLSITLVVIGRHDLNRPAIADDVMDEAAAHLPAPGYADIVFRDAPN